MQTDVCGIKWTVYRERESPVSLDPGDDLVLSSYRRCLERDILSVWRRVPKRSLITYDIDESGNQVCFFWENFYTNITKSGHTFADPKCELGTRSRR